MDKPIFIRSGDIEVEIHPSHPRYHELRMELIRESHPEVPDEDPLDKCENLSPKQAEANLRQRFISPELGDETGG